MQEVVTLNVRLIVVPIKANILRLMRLARLQDYNMTAKVIPAMCTARGIFLQRHLAKYWKNTKINNGGKLMFIPAFVCGVSATVIAEFILLVVIAIFRKR